MTSSFFESMSRHLPLIKLLCTYMIKKYCKFVVKILPEIVKNIGSSFKMERVVGPIVGGAHYRKPIIRPKIQTWWRKRESAWC